MYASVFVLHSLWGGHSKQPIVLVQYIRNIACITSHEYAVCSGDADVAAQNCIPYNAEMLA